MKRVLFFIYAIGCYAFGMSALVYAMAFLGNTLVSRRVDGVQAVPFIEALLTDTVLLTIFAVQHSVMAREGFKRIWTRIVPQPIERSTFVLFSGAALWLLMWYWQPLGGIVWQIDSHVGHWIVNVLYALGWVIVVAATALINHFDLFGLRQAWYYFKGIEYRPLAFKTPGFYKVVRHPLYFGMMVAFWSTPVMTYTRLFFACVTTAYLLIAMRFFEERDLIRHFGRQYQAYREAVPMIFPSLRAWRKTARIENSQAATVGGN